VRKNTPAQSPVSLDWALYFPLISGAIQCFVPRIGFSEIGNYRSAVGDPESRQHGRAGTIINVSASKVHSAYCTLSKKKKIDSENAWLFILRQGRHNWSEGHDFVTTNSDSHFRHYG